MKTHLSLILFLPSMFLASTRGLAAGPAPEKSPKIGGTYQWTEGPKTSDTRQWIARVAVDAQSKSHPEIGRRLIEMLAAESGETSCEQRGLYFFTKSGGKEKPASIYLRKGLNAADELLIDAAKSGRSQRASVALVDVSRDGALVAYTIREGKAEEQTVHIFDVNTRRDLPATLPGARYNTVSFTPDGKGIYYAKIAPTGTRVFLHLLGTDSSTDKLIFGDSYNYEPLGPMDLISTQVTENGRFLLMSVARGMPAKRIDLYSQELDEPDQRVWPIIHGMESQFVALNHDEDIFALTNNEAPKKRIVTFEIDKPSPRDWETLVPEGKEAISEISIVGDRLFVSGRQGASTRTRIFTLDGKETGQVVYPAIGSPLRVFVRCPVP